MPVSLTAPTLELQVKGALVGFVAAAFASFLPDLDHPGSTVGRYFPRWVRKSLGGHRMGAHSLLAVFLAWWLAGYLVADPILANAMAVGWMSHVVCDLLTVDGVGLAYPLSRHKFRIGWMVTGSKTEDRFVLGMKFLGGMLAVGYGFLFVQSVGGF